MTFFAKLTDTADKAEGLREALHGRRSDSCFTVAVSDLRAIPGTPFAYWFSPHLRSLFTQLPAFSERDRFAKVGLQTSDNERFCRAWWEIPGAKGAGDWRPFTNGGASTPFHRRIALVVNWSDDGLQIKEFRDTQTGRVKSRPQNEQYYGRAGLTWPLRAARFTPQAHESGSVISVRGYGAFIDGDILPVWSLMSSAIFDGLFKASLGRSGHPEFVVGRLVHIPVPDLRVGDADQLRPLARRGWSIRRSLDTAHEASHAFVIAALLQVAGASLESRVSAWGQRVAEAMAGLALVQTEIDELCFELYGISEEDRRAITEGFGVADSDDEFDGDANDDDASDAEVELDLVGLAAGLVSWAVGVAAGRFDVRLATGQRGQPVEPDPFDPLPVCSPGMLTDDDGLPLASPPQGYPIEPSPVLVDDLGHDLDVTARVRAVFDLVFGDQADAWWSDVGAVLDAKNGVEGWLRRGFFEFHLGVHSPTGRISPVLWPIGTTSGSYRIWLYAHQVTNDTLFRVLGDVVEPKLATEQRRLSDLTQEFGPSPSASLRRTLDVQQSLVDELIELRDQLRAVAPLWSPDLNDGIVIVLSPLWRLFAHHRAWSKELKDRWGKLAKGEYDWAQLAMHIWPERVIPKCAEDRSLAIAHDLEDTFWAQDPTNADKWHPRRLPTTPIEQLIAERTNPTIDAARDHPSP